MTAPIPGRIACVLVEPGETVEKNAPLVVVEAMKMELTLRAPRAGRIAEVRRQGEDIVEERIELVTFAADDSK